MKINTETIQDRPSPVVLSIAGSDSSGGAGIQADIKTGAAFGVHVATAITAVTAQNSAAVLAAYPLTPDQLISQIEAVTSELPVAAIKLGMLANQELMNAVADILGDLADKKIPVVIDPVLGATSGGTLISGQSVVSTYIERLFPLATVITPNLLEAAWLLDTDVAADYEQMEQQAQALQQLGASAVLLKGGHADMVMATDCLASDDMQAFSGPRHDTTHTHGSGCTLAAAIAAGLAQGLSLKQSVASAKSFVQGAIQHSARLKLAPKNGPLHHFYQYW